MVGLLMRFAVDISALAGFCQSWQAEKFYLKGCSLLNLQDTKLWLTLFFGECINNKSRSLKITIKILLKFKRKKKRKKLVIFRQLCEGCESRQRRWAVSLLKAFWQLSIFKVLEEGDRAGEKKSASEPSRYVFYQTLSQSLLCNSFMQDLWHNSYFFPPAIIYDK